MGGEKFSLAWLREGKVEFCALDLFLEAKETKLSVSGKATVHLTGYFEAEDDDESMDDVPAAAAKKASPKVDVKTSPKASVAGEKAASPKVAVQAAKAKA